MTFGYDSRVVGSKSVIGMMENANSLLTQLSLLRNSDKVSKVLPFAYPKPFAKEVNSWEKARPLIFVGHSLGGLVIKKVIPVGNSIIIILITLIPWL